MTPDFLSVEGSGIDYLKEEPSSKNVSLQTGVPTSLSGRLWSRRLPTNFEDRHSECSIPPFDTEVGLGEFLTVGPTYNLGTPRPELHRTHTTREDLPYGPRRSDECGPKRQLSKLDHLIIVGLGEGGSFQQSRVSALLYLVNSKVLTQVFNKKFTITFIQFGVSKISRERYKYYLLCVLQILLSLSVNYFFSVNYFLCTRG